MPFSTKKWPLSGGALRAQFIEQFISNLAARYARKEWVGGRGPARYARTYFVIEAERQFVTSLAWRRCRPLSVSHQPSGDGHRAG